MAIAYLREELHEIHEFESEERANSFMDGVTAGVENGEKFDTLDVLRTFNPVNNKWRVELIPGIEVTHIQLLSRKKRTDESILDGATIL